MDFKLNSRAITFLGLFFLASISLHSISHIDDNFLELKPQAECQSCHNDPSSDLETLAFPPQKNYGQLAILFILQNATQKLKKPFNSQAPPKN